MLFTSHTKSSDFDEANIELVILDSGERRVVHRGGTYGRYVASGHLVYANGVTLFAMPFDPDRLEATGSAAPVIEGVKTSPNEGSAQYSVSPDGKLAYVSGRAGAVGHSVVWLDRQGATEVLWDDEQIYRNPRFSPDGTRLAVEIDVEGQSDVWIYDIERDVPTRLTFSEADDSSAHWSPDGEYLYFSSTRDGVANLYRKLADGSGEAERLSESVNLQFSSSVSPDGRLLAFNEQVEGGNWDLYFLPLEEGAEPEPFVVSPFLEAIPRFSPNGRWVAYVSNESETFEVYVRPVSGRGKWQISSGGGSWPVWSRDGTELFYWFGSELHVAEVDTEADTFRAGRSRRLLEAQVADIGVSNPSDISPDGERFVIFHSPAAASPDSHDHIRLVLNWFEELERTFGGER